MRFDSERWPGGGQSDEIGLDGISATVFKPVLIRADGRDGLCLLQSLSPVDMLGRVYTDFAPGESVSVHLCSARVVAGRVGWSKFGRIGIRFDAELDVEQVLEDMNARKIDGRINRSLRVAIACVAELIIDGRSRPVRLRDISQRGMKVETDALRSGQQVLVRLEGLDPREAAVRWTGDGTAGLAFVRPLMFDELAKWHSVQQSD